MSFKNTDGTWLALGALAAIGAAGAMRGRGSRVDLPEVWQEPGRRQHGNVPMLRQRAELALSDADLGHRIMTGGDVLGELSFEDAARVDPRRIDALISQRMGRAFAEVMGGNPGPEAEEMYLTSVRFARNAYGGDLPTRAIVSLIEENLDRSLFSTWPWLPESVKAHIRENLHVFNAALDEAVVIANQAAAATRNTPDNAEWQALAEHLEGHKPLMRTALSTRRLDGPMGTPPPGLPGRYRALGGPRRR